MGLHTFSNSHIDFRAISEEMQPVIEATFNATISIVDPDISGGTYNRTTNTTTGRGPVTLWSGPARAQAMRWPNVASPRGEATSLRTIVFHIPREIDINVSVIREGFRIEVTDGAMSPEFEDGIFVITSSVNGSYAWDRRIETMHDQGIDRSV